MLQAILLAAGRSTRTYPLTVTRPKPLIPLLGRPLLEHLLRQIEGLVDEAILVIGYRADAIRGHFGPRFGTLPLRYLVQTEQRGTADALLQAAPWVKDRCLVLNGDDLYHRHDLEALTRHGTAILVTPVPDPENRGVVTIEGDRVVDIVEKPTNAPPSSLASVGGYALERAWLKRLEEVRFSSRGELELPDFIQLLARESEVRYHRIERYWLPLTYAWDVLRATFFLLEDEGRARDLGVLVQNPEELADRRDIQLGSGTVVEGPVLIGSGVNVGSSCSLRGPAVIGEDCTIGDEVVVDRSVLFRGARISNLASVSYSVLGEGVHIGRGARLLAEPPPGDPLNVTLKGQSVSTRLNRLGLIAGDRAEVPAASNVPPGTLLAPEQRLVT
jgi:UDP-N-acetylglucosamine diphosphorylase / glucose-1-phosphate thymidylyltransferase / UDP-N-acetylgalactosamine diphosphorylase / glucosamine-1-phosphate N-acetyltransferase / galactosamine-1-phosphate N-acetyltransferase